ncbi:MAG TPA: response regulator transcription factor [Burkholderiales bacterium]|nr:response regulator transcription factor [Burkholderiales bacterium]
MKILLIDDHALIRDALRGVLAELQRGSRILEAHDAQSAMKLLQAQADVQLVVLDLNLPDRGGFDVLAEIRERYPAIGVVVLSGNHDRASVQKALDLGALGFIPKSSPREVMLSAFNLIFAGGVYIPPQILERAAAPPTAPPRSARSIAADLGLTERQVDVLALMMRGKSNKVICRALNLAEPTVKNHVTAILKALKATNRTEAVIVAGALGFESPDGPH